MKGHRSNRGSNSSVIEKLKQKVALAGQQLSQNNLASDEHIQSDHFHNSAFPCCNEVKEVIDDVFMHSYASQTDDISSSPKSKSSFPVNPPKSSLLGTLIHDNLLEDYKTKLHENNRRTKLIPISEKNESDNGQNLNTASFSSVRDDTCSNTSLDELTVENDNEVSSFDSYLCKLLHQSQNTHSKPILNRSLSSFVQYLQDCNQNHTFSSSSSSKTANSKVLHKKSNSNINVCTPNLSLDYILNCCNEIQCQTCRNDALQYITRITSDSSFFPHEQRKLHLDWGDELEDKSQTKGSNVTRPKINNNNSLGTLVIDSNSVESSKVNGSKKQMRKSVPGISIPIAGYYSTTDDDCCDNLDRAFDYHELLEEGEGLLDAVDTDTSCKNIEAKFYFKMKLMEQNSYPYARELVLLQDPHSFPSSALDFLKFIRHIIFPCGIQMLDDKSDRNNEVPPDKIQMMKQGIKNRLSIMNDCYDELLSSKSRIETLLDKAIELSISSTPFDEKSTIILQECDFFCEKYMSSFSRFLLILHSDTLLLQTINHGKKTWIKNLIESLWRAFEDTRLELIRPTLEYRWKCICLEDGRAGVVTPLYSKTIQRTRYLDMMRAKFVSISNLHHKLQSVDHSSNKNHHIQETNKQNHVTTLLQKISALATYVSCVINLKEDKSHDLYFIHHYGSVLESCNKLICGSIIETNSNKLSENDRILDLSVKVNNLIDKILKEGESYLSSIPSKLNTLWQTYRIVIEEKIMDTSMYSDTTPSLQNDQKNIEFITCLVQEVGKLFCLFGQIKIASLNHIKHDKDSITDIPTWIEGCYLEDFLLMTHPETKSRSGVLCSGGDGKRRVLGIISAFLYKWLQERCLEWHADLTQKELLMEDAQIDKNQTDIAKVLHKSKKSAQKKRQKKKLGGNTCIDAACEQISGRTDDISSNMNKPSLQSLSIDNSKENHNSFPLNNLNQNENAETDFTECILYSNNKVNIGIQDGQSIIPVEDFLSQRFTELLRTNQYTVI